MLDADSDADVVAFLSPLPGASPSGDDLEYDPAFLELVEAGQDKPEIQYGDTVQQVARAPEWPVVRQHALALARRTRDVRIIVWLVRSGARLHGLAGFTTALEVLGVALRDFWPTIHPALDPADGNDPTARLNALTPLITPAAGLADLRAAAIAGDRGGPTVRDVELAFARAEPLAGESVPTREGLIQALQTAGRADPAVLQRLVAGEAALIAIVEVLDREVGVAAVPDFAMLQRVLKALAEAGRAASGGTLSPGGATPDVRSATGGTASVAGPVGPIASREDLLRLLDSACVWLEANDSSNPAPLLIRRAQRLVSKDFLAIIRDLAPDSLDQIEKLAGLKES